MMDKRLSNAELVKVVGRLAKDCEDYRDETAPDRIRAMEYYDGVMADLTAPTGRSQVVSRDVRSSIKKVLPSIVRTILHNDEIFEFNPVGEGDEEHAEQATDYINYVVFPESDGHRALADAIHDALRLRNGIVKCWYDEKIEVEVSNHTGLSEEDALQLAEDDAVDVMEKSEYQEEIETPEGMIPVPMCDLRIRRKKVEGSTKIMAMPRESFLIHPDAIEIETSPVVGEKRQLRRSDLVAMGYDKETIYNLPIGGASDFEEEVEEQGREREPDLDRDDYSHKALQEVDYYEVYVKVDRDGDGIGELIRCVFAGGLNEQHLLEAEDWDEIPYVDIKCEERPHHWEGHSVTDDVMDIQKRKTVVQRQAFDNIYHQNMRQPIIKESAVVNPDSILNPEFGKPILVDDGYELDDAVKWDVVPNIAKDTFSMLEYMDQELEDRTGISDASAGMAPDALQNMTAKASAMMEQAGIGQTEMMVRTIANGVKAVGRLLLKLQIKHQDKPRQIRLKGEWVQFDPRQWNAEMDLSVNTGLGAGTRERDMMMMQLVMGVQEKILASLGADNPYIKPDNLYNSVSKMIEAAGLKSVDMYVTKPDEQEVAQKLEQARNRPDPEAMKIQAQMAIEDKKLQNAKQLKELDIMGNRDKEQAQLDADIQVRRAELEKEQITRIEEINANSGLEQQKLSIERAKIAQDSEDKRQDRIYQLELEKAKILAQPTGEGETGQTSQALAQISNMIAQMNAPKQIIRDENGDVIGMETVLN